MTVYKASTKYLYSEIDSEAVILDVNSGTYFGLNEVSNSIWQMLQTPASQQQLVEKILAEYEVTEEQAVSDIESLLKEMLDTGLVEVANEEVAKVS
ncbi:MAG: PqqD family protein [Cyanobacteria bacterium J06600_6]